MRRKAEVHRTHGAGGRLLPIVAALICGFALLQSAAADTKCLSERRLAINTSRIEAFGLARHFPQLPLGANEYVLTFDDGPNGKTTPSLLHSLRNACVHATFFMIGKNAARDPVDVRAIVDTGNTLGSHSHDHRDLTKLSFDDAVADIKLGKTEVERAAAGMPPVVNRLFRFPDNYETPALIESARAMGLTIASYDISPADWRGSPPNESFDRFKAELNRADRGVIVLHDSQPNTVLLLPMILTELRQRRATIVALAPH